MEILCTENFLTNCNKILILITAETTDENIQIIFQDFSELQAVETLPVIDVSTVEHVIKCDDKILWEEVLTLPSDGSINTIL